MDIEVIDEKKRKTLKSRVQSAKSKTIRQEQEQTKEHIS